MDDTREIERLREVVHALEDGIDGRDVEAAVVTAEKNYERKYATKRSVSHLEARVAVLLLTFANFTHVTPDEAVNAFESHDLYFTTEVP